MDSQEQRLIASLYEAALEPDKWGAALQKLATAVGATGAHVILWNEATLSTPFFAHFGVDLDGIIEYDRHWGAHDPRRKFLMEQPAGAWLGCHRICDEEFVRRDPFYQEYLPRWDVRHALVSKLGDTPDLSAMMAIFRPPGTERFGRDDEARLMRQNQHLQNALRVQLRLGQAAARVRVMEELAHQHPGALLILKSDGQVHFMNAAAEAMLASPGAPLAIRNGRVSALSLNSTQRLRRMVHTAATAGEGGALRLRRNESVFLHEPQRAFNLIVCPLSARLRLMHAATEPLALVMASDEADPARAAPAVLQALFGFTPAETRLALALLAGDTPDDYAGAQQVKIATVRTQIAALKDKTGTRRHTDLVALLLKVPVAFDREG